MEPCMHEKCADRSKRIWSKIFQHMDTFSLIIMGMLFLICGLQLALAHSELGLRPETIGPGAYMAGIGFLLLLFSIIESYIRIKKKNPVKRMERIPASTLKGFFLLALCACFMPIIGFSVSVFLLIVLFMTWVTKQHLLKSMLSSIIITVVYYIIFVKVAGIVLPRGVIGF
jgi:membrane protease YdiL (CAAX protease family)